MPTAPDRQLYDGTLVATDRRAASHLHMDPMAMPYQLILPSSAEGDKGQDATPNTVRPQAVATDVAVDGSRTAAWDSHARDAQVATQPQAGLHSLHGQHFAQQAAMATHSDRAARDAAAASHASAPPSLDHGSGGGGGGFASTLASIRDAMARDATQTASRPDTPVGLHAMTANAPGLGAQATEADRGRDSHTVTQATSGAPGVTWFTSGYMAAAGDGTRRAADAALVQGPHAVQGLGNVGQGQGQYQYQYAAQMPGASDRPQQDAAAHSQYASWGYGLDTGAGGAPVAVSQQPSRDASAASSQYHTYSNPPTYATPGFTAAQDGRSRDAAAYAQYGSQGYVVEGGAGAAPLAVSQQPARDAAAAAVQSHTYTPPATYMTSGYQGAQDGRHRDAGPVSQLPSAGYVLQTGGPPQAVSQQPARDAAAAAVQSHTYTPPATYMTSGFQGTQDGRHRDAAPASQLPGAGYVLQFGGPPQAVSQQPARDAAVSQGPALSGAQIAALQGAHAGRMAPVHTGSTRDASVAAGAAAAHYAQQGSVAAAALPSYGDGTMRGAGDATPNASHLNHGYAVAGFTTTRPGPGVSEGTRSDDQAVVAGLANFGTVGSVTGRPGATHNLVGQAGSGYAGDSAVLPHGVSPVGLAGLLGHPSLAMPAHGDGAHAGRDSVARTAGVALELPFVEQPRGVAVADRVPNTRTTAFAPVSNNRTLYWTGQSVAPGDLPGGTGLSEMDSHGDSRDDFGPQALHTSLIREAYTRAHPSTRGDAAEFRNQYHTALRKGLVEPNMETLRATMNPQRVLMEQAMAVQLARSAAAQANPDPIMCRTIDAYESDVAASDMEL
jgi:hypothetical protein